MAMNVCPSDKGKTTVCQAVETVATSPLLRGGRPVAWVLAALLLTLGCDDPPPPSSGGGGETTAAPEKKPAAKPPVARPLKPGAKAEAEPSEPTLSEQDFVEGPNNRDPFRSFIDTFARSNRVAQARQRTVYLRRYGLDELKLVAVVSGSNTRPLAMFRDPKGLGVTVRRGDFVSKNEGRIKEILRDKVVVEIEEIAEDRKRRTDRVLELHEKDEETELE